MKKQCFFTLKKIPGDDDSNNTDKSLTENSHITFPPALQHGLQDWRDDSVQSWSLCSEKWFRIHDLFVIVPVISGK